MENTINYNQAVFGLMLLGAKADGKLQEDEKHLLVELSSEEHHLTAEEYKDIIIKAKEKTDADFAELVYHTLNQCTETQRINAIYWLYELITADRSSDEDESGSNESEMTVYHQSISRLQVSAEAVAAYIKSRS